MKFNHDVAIKQEISQYTIELMLNEIIIFIAPMTVSINDIYLKRERD